MKKSYSTLGERLWLGITTTWACGIFSYLRFYDWYPNFSFHASLIYMLSYLICLFIMYKKVS